MSDNIPIEIQIEIIKRVPVKSLFRFRSVSKSWKSLIDSSQFIADYNACESRPQRLLIKYHTEYRFWESLAVLEHYTDAGKPVCDVWVMEHGVPKSFTKLFTITTPNARLTRVLGFRKNGEVIFEAKTDDEDYEGCEPAVLKVYDTRSQHINDIGIYGKRASFVVSSYTETLLLLDQVKSSHEIQVSMH